MTGTTSLQDAIRRAVGDPGSITPRRHAGEDSETVTDWSARAVLELLQVTHGVDPDGHYANTPAANALLENAGLRGRLRLADDIMFAAWGVIATAENFKSNLVCEHEHCVDRQHWIGALKTEPIGDDEWRNAAYTWRDTWDAFQGAAGTRQVCVDSHCQQQLHVYVDPAAANAPIEITHGGRVEPPLRNATPEEVQTSLDGAPFLDGVIYPVIGDQGYVYPDGEIIPRRSRAADSTTEYQPHGPNEAYRYASRALRANAAHQLAGWTAGHAAGWHLAADWLMYLALPLGPHDTAPPPAVDCPVPECARPAGAWCTGVGDNVHEERVALVFAPTLRSDDCPRCGGLDGTHTVRDCAGRQA